MTSWWCKVKRENKISFFHIKNRNLSILFSPLFNNVYTLLPSKSLISDQFYNENNLIIIYHAKIPMKNKQIKLVVRLFFFLILYKICIAYISIITNKFVKPCTAGVTKWRPTSCIRPVDALYPARRLGGKKW